MDIQNSNKKFRKWVQQMWYDHVDELTAYGQSLHYSSKEYFNKYKFWLKQKFRHYLEQEKGSK